MSDRVQKLELTLSLIEEITHRLSYLRPTMLGLMTSISMQKRFSELGIPDACRIALVGGGSFSESWRAAVYAQRGALGSVAADVLLSLGDVLGSTDLESQLAAIACAKELLEGQLSAAREERAQKGRLCRTMGVLCGIGIAILLI